MRSAWLLLTGAALLVSCKQQAPGTGSAPAEADQVEPEALTSSQELVANLPLLPMIEKSLWRQLMEAEAGRSPANLNYCYARKQDVRMRRCS